MPFYLGTTAISKAYLGTDEVSSMYLGTTRVWANEPVFSAASTCPSTTNDTTTGTWSHAGGSGANLAAIVVIQGLGPSLVSAYGVTYGGVSMTNRYYLRGRSTNDDNAANLAVFSLLNCGTGTKTVNVTCSVGSNIHKAHVITYSGVGAINAAGSVGGAVKAMTLTASSAQFNRLFAAFCSGQGSNDTTPLSGFTGSQRVNYRSDGSFITYNALAAGDYAGASSVACAATANGAYAYCAAALDLVAP